MDYSDLRVTIIGMAREGMAVGRFLATHGARVIISDIKSAADLAKEVEELAEWPIECVLGHHPEDILDTDVVYVSPGVPRTIPILRQAKSRGVRISSETELLFELCQAPIIGITGSSGKTTTTTLIGEMMEMEHPNGVWVGGNIGRPLIEYVGGDIKPSHWVVLELSSFQLEHMQCSPHIALVTNLRPNHLDRHPSYEAYKEAKINVLAHQRSGDIAVLNWDDPEVRVLADRTAARVRWFSRQARLTSGDGAYVEDDWIVLKDGDTIQRVMPVASIKLPGKHNLENVLAAISVVSAAHLQISSAVDVAQTFKGVPHRLQTIRIREGVRWVNDSIATSPDRTLAALRAYPPKDSLILLAGGRDKHLPMEEMAQEIVQRVKHVIFFGEAGPLIEKEVQKARSEVTNSTVGISACQTLEEAVVEANQVAYAGDIVLLSPSGTSFDAYPNYEVRGEHFQELVMGLEG
ncbi:MAG: UDP-N-acetylmuramoyl-L-alanine--D-glutamate ligase [Ardenticatenaceae bacterium]